MRSFYFFFPTQRKPCYGQLCLPSVRFTFTDVSAASAYREAVSIAVTVLCENCERLHIDCIAHLRVLETLSEGGKVPHTNTIEHLMGALGSYVVGAIIEKDCNAVSTFLEVYMLNPFIPYL